MLSDRHGDGHAEDSSVVTSTASTGRTYEFILKQFPMHLFELLVLALEAVGFTERKPGEGFPDIMWAGSTQRLARGIGPDTRVNRLGWRCELTHKHSLLRQLRLADAVSLAPQTFILPDEREALVAAVRAASESDTARSLRAFENRWVLKPAARGRGLGIVFTTDPVGVDDPRRIILETTKKANVEAPCVVSQYIEPLTLPYPCHGASASEERFKVDLRLYVLVTDTEPLEAFLHSSALVRYAFAPYSLLEDSLADPKVHLTNTSWMDSRLQAQARPRNLPLDDLLSFVAATRGSSAVTRLQSSLGMLVWKALCTIPTTQMPRRRLGSVRDFELMGFDVLLDVQLRPWLLEVNSAPDFSISCATSGQLNPEHKVKAQVIADLLSVLWPPPGTCWEEACGGFMRLPLQTRCHDLSA